MYPEGEFLDCDTCGVHLKTLTPAESQKVATNPYNYIVFCKRCQEDEYTRLDIRLV